MTVTKTTANGNRGRVGRSTRDAILEAESRLIHGHVDNHTLFYEVLRESGVGNFFFFKQKTAYEMAQCDWSLDVCSSDLIRVPIRLDQFASHKTTLFQSKESPPKF